MSAMSEISDEELNMYSLLPVETRARCFDLYESIDKLNEKSRAYKRQKDMYDCITLINHLFSDQKQVPAYEMRLTPIAETGKNTRNQNEQEPDSLLPATGVKTIRIEIIRWGSGVKEVEYGKTGIDRYTVGEYEFDVRSSHCVVFKLPHSIHSSNPVDSEMFLKKGWASVLVHTRVLLSSIISRKFEITAAHEQTRKILEKYDGLCEKKGSSISFYFRNNLRAVALKALFCVVQKITTEITNGDGTVSHQLIMDSLAATRDRYHDLIV